MIAFILGTSDGRKLLREINKFTDDILLSTATTYGGELLKEYKYRYLNTTPLNKEELKKLLKEKKVRVLVDLSHPYAIEISKNAMDCCDDLHIEYIRYERKAVIDKYKENKNVKFIKKIEDLSFYLKYNEGNILNTMGSNKIKDILDLNLPNRIIHRVLPTKSVIEKCVDLGIDIGDIIGIKGPIGYDLNLAFLKAYDIKVMLLKDSGEKGATEEKLKSALDLNVQCYVLERETINYKNKFSNEEDIINYLECKYFK